MTDQDGAGRPAPPTAPTKKAAAAKKAVVVKKAGVPKKAVVAKKAVAKKAALAKKPVVVKKAVVPKKAVVVKKAVVKKAVAKKAVAKKASKVATPGGLPVPPPPAAPPPPTAPPPPAAPPPAPGPPQWPAPEWPPPAWPPPPPSVRPREGLATAAIIAGAVSVPLVLTIIGAWLVGFGAIVVGVAALSRIRSHPERSGRGMAIGGLVMGIVSIVLTIPFLAFLGGDEDDNELDTVSYLELETGDCYERESPLLSGVTLEDCTFGHDREVVGVVDHPAPPGAPFPGREALDRRAEELCSPLYDAYLGADADRTTFVQQNLQPTRGAWREGNRRLVCSVERRDERPLVGSVKNGGRAFNR